MKKAAIPPSPGLSLLMFSSELWRNLFSSSAIKFVVAHKRSSICRHQDHFTFLEKPHLGWEKSKRHLCCNDKCQHHPRSSEINDSRPNLRQKHEVWMLEDPYGQDAEDMQQKWLSSCITGCTESSVFEAYPLVRLQSAYYSLFHFDHWLEWD